MPFFKIFNLLIKIFLCYYPRCIYMDTTHDKISRDKAAFAVRDRAISEIKSNYPGSKLFFVFYKSMLRASKILQVVIIIYFLTLLVCFAEKLLPI